ncbi:MAG: hypothetical protein DI539_10380 [Flavobacterium psychrophilum]|nr:MAG: hypothetical protein DI539_10380 [Flavobacterium psychrophilum]
MHSTLLKSLVVTVFFVTAFSCGTSEDGSEGIGSGGNGSASSKLGGSYNIISMVSDISVDLNNDGTSSTDLLTEIDPEVFSTQIPELEIKPVVVNNQLENMMSFYLPHSNVTTGSSSSQTSVNFTKTGLGYVYEFDNSTQTISVKDSTLPGGQPGVYGHIESIEVIDNNMLKAIFTKYYYNFSGQPGWKLLTITCVYTKV